MATVTVTCHRFKSCQGLRGFRRQWQTVTCKGLVSETQAALAIREVQGRVSESTGADGTREEACTGPRGDGMPRHLSGEPGVTVGWAMAWTAARG